MNNKLNIMLFSESYQRCEEQHTSATVWGIALFNLLGCVPTHCILALKIQPCWCHDHTSTYSFCSCIFFPALVSQVCLSLSPSVYVAMF